MEGEVMRIGLMGVQASPDHLVTAVTALAAGVRDFSLDVDVGEGGGGGG
jgi:alanine-glyoxylate transaminase/serine-glyoxylate transaminase/serine-pyruvate transaminase